MKAKIGGLISVLVLLIGCASFQPDYIKAENSVVIIVHEYGLTTGVLISEDGYILSCAHGGEPKFVYAKQYYDDTRFPLITKTEDVYTIFRDLNLDVAIYKTVDSRIFVPSKISNKPLKKGDDVFSIGNPLGQPFYLSWGKMLKDVYDADIGLGYIVHSCSGNQGNSGGPLFNRRGEVVGINVLMQAAIPTYAGYVPLLDGMIAIKINDLLPGITGIIETHRRFQQTVKEFDVLEKHIEELEAK